MLCNQLLFHRLNSFRSFIGRFQIVPRTLQRVHEANKPPQTSHIYICCRPVGKYTVHILCLYGDTVRLHLRVLVPEGVGGGLREAQSRRAGADVFSLRLVHQVSEIIQTLHWNHHTVHGSIGYAWVATCVSYIRLMRSPRGLRIFISHS